MNWLMRLPAWLLIGVSLLLLGLMIVVPIPASTLLWRALFNAAHLPLFVGVSVVSFVLLSRRDNRGLQTSRRAVIMTMVIGVVLAVGTELAQVIGPRDADVGDIFRDLAGTLVGLLWITSRQQPWSMPKFLTMGVAIVLVGIVLAPVPLILRAQQHRAALFPRLSGFATRWDRVFIDVRDAEIAFVAPPVRRDSTEPALSARVVFHPAEYPTLEITEPEPDWRSYQEMCATVLNPADTVVRLYVRIHDSHHNMQHDDRYNAGFLLLPGHNELRVQLTSVEAAPLGRTMDMSRIVSVMFFLASPPTEVTLYFLDLRLSRQGAFSGATSGAGYRTDFLPTDTHGRWREDS